MKRSTLARQQGAVELGAGLLCLGAEAYFLSTGSYVSAAIFSPAALVSAPILIADGGYDLIHGTHHYLPQKLYQKFKVQDEDVKRQIQETLDMQKERKDEEVPERSLRETLDLLLERYFDKDV